MNDRDKKYQALLNILPSEIKDKFLIPLANKDPIAHDHIARFLMIITDKDYTLTKGVNK